MNIGGLNTNKKFIQARKTCAFCGESFKEQESKTTHDDEFYHLDCYDELVYKVNVGEENERDREAGK